MQSPALMCLAALWWRRVISDTVPIESGDTLFLKSRSGSGHHIEVEGIDVRARWQERGGWQALVVEKTGGGPIHAGDSVFLKTHSGTFIDVEGVAVQARWREQETWQGFVVEKTGGGAIHPGDNVCLLSHTGHHIDVEGDSVQARWNDCGALQQLMVQKEVPSALSGGATVFLKTHVGTYIDVESQAAQARWPERELWQELVVEIDVGNSIFTGDSIFLKAHTGLHMDVEGDNVQARWHDHGKLQALTIEKSLAGPVFPGDVVFLKAPTGKYIDAQGDGLVRARWSEQGTWQSFVIEFKTTPPATTSLEAPTTPGPSTSKFLATTKAATTSFEATTTPTPTTTPFGPTTTLALASTTTTPMTPPSAELLESAAAQVIAIIAAAPNRGDALGGIVRLAFHDAGTWDGRTGGADGCVDLASPENAGLEAVVAQLSPVVTAMSGALSRADVWALAGNVAVEFGDGPAMEYEVGRHDAEDCQGHGSRLPNAELAQAHIRDVFLTRYGFTERETAALMGAHVLGRAEPTFSGYSGAWVPRNDRFSNDWFSDLLARPWEKRSFASGDRTLTQWDGPGGTMMLNTDVELAFDTLSATCNVAGGNPRRGSCPRATHAFSGAVTEFAASQDAFHVAFAPAFKKLMALGAGSLVCALPDCSTPGPDLGGGGRRRRPVPR